MARKKAPSLPTLGRVIRDLMDARPGMSLRALEAKSGVSRSELSNIIRGVRKRPDPAALKAIAGPLGVDARYLLLLSAGLSLDDAGEMSSKYAPRKTYAFTESKAGRAREADAVKYLDRIGRLSQEGKEALDLIIEADEARQRKK